MPRWFDRSRRSAASRKTLTLTEQRSIPEEPQFWTGIGPKNRNGSREKIGHSPTQGKSALNPAEVGERGAGA